MKLSQLLTAPNQLTLLRMMFLPFIVIKLVEGHYSLALILFVLAGMSDGLDGLLARTLKQQTILGQYLDPIADKLLLSTMFMVLSILHRIPWKFTVVVFSRDISILMASAVLYAIAGLRDFRPSIFGKANTFANHTRPEFVLLAVRDDQPVSLVGAFERPVRPSDSGYVAESAARLLSYLAEQDEVYGTAPRLTVAAYPQWLAEAISQTKTGAEIPARDPLPAALQRVRAELDTLLPA